MGDLAASGRGRSRLWKCGGEDLGDLTLGLRIDLGAVAAYQLLPWLLPRIA
jgi:hypothetical protein